MSWFSNEFDNALAWFKSIPRKVATTAEQAAQWLWEVIQGDFAEEQTTAQIVTNTAISMIPLVDQICDVRDLIANCIKIYEHGQKPEAERDEESSLWNWIALVLTLIGLFPTLGSLFKGCFKVLFAYIRKAIHKAGLAKAGKAGAGLVEGAWHVIEPMLESGIAKLNEFIARPAVRKMIADWHIDNFYKAFADKLRELSGMLSPGVILRKMDELLNVLKELLEKVQKWGSAAMQTSAGQLLAKIHDVRKAADRQLGKALSPVQEILDRTAKRLEIEHKAAYKAVTNKMNPATFKRIDMSAEAAEYVKKKPAYVKLKGKKLRYPPAELKHYDAALIRDQDVVPRAIREGRLKTAPGASAPQPVPNLATHKTYRTFGTDLRIDVLPPGTKLYRVMDPGSNARGVFWMTEEEFLRLRSRNSWREQFAVWVNWNRNGHYVTYTVPDEGMVVWRGKAATQEMQGTKFTLTGGREQISVDPSVLQGKHFSTVMETGWGVDDYGIVDVGMVGVPSGKP